MSIACASSSSVRALSSKGKYGLSKAARGLSGYAPQIDGLREEPRPPRPASPAFFTGRPTYHEAISDLRSTLSRAQAALRSSHVYPLPSRLPLPQPPRASFHSSTMLSALLGTHLRTNTHRDVLHLLNELHQLRYLAELSGKGDVSDLVDGVLGRYERPLSEGSSKTKAIQEVDEYGRAYGMGRRKESSARVWMIANPKAKNQLDTPSTDNAATGTIFASSEVLINHLPLSTHFPRLTDREAVVRPLQITGLLGAYNIFALVRGGGTTGQAGAVGLGVARALAILREDVRDVLQADGALMRDTRMVERKKTGNAKARKQYAWVKR